MFVLLKNANTSLAYEMIGFILSVVIWTCREIKKVGNHWFNKYPFSEKAIFSITWEKGNTYPYLLLQFLVVVTSCMVCSSKRCGLCSYKRRNNDITLHKLNTQYEIKRLSVSLLKIYLEHRSHYVVVNDSRSQMGTFTCGVPQGSTLGWASPIVCKWFTTYLKF